MGKYDKLLERLLSGRHDKSFRFADISNLLKALGFSERIKGDHHIYYKDGVQEILNLQPKDGQAKPYQVRQVRTIIVRYRLEVEHEQV